MRIIVFLWQISKNKSYICTKLLPALGKTTATITEAIGTVEVMVAESYYVCVCKCGYLPNTMFTMALVSAFMLKSFIGTSLPMGEEITPQYVPLRKYFFSFVISAIVAKSQYI